MINVIRRQLAPASLSDRKAYRNEDVLEALHEDFRKKCYLTEVRFPDKESMEIDHFVTQNEDSNRAYDWENLYPIHEKANKQRPKTTPLGGYLDPCSDEDDVEQVIVYNVSFSGEVNFRARDIMNQKAVNTAALLKRVHRDFKQAIKEKHHEILNEFNEWRHAQAEGNIGKAEEKEMLLRNLLSRDSSYTMLMRTIHNLPIELFD